MIKEYDKLVRDNIPEMIVSEGKTCKYRQANETERLDYLKAKVQEELDEFKEAYKEDSLTNMQKELVDLITATLSYIKEKQNHIPYCDEDYEINANIDDLTDYYRCKLEDKGGFKKGYILLEVGDKEC